ncbi:hypothetical protein FOA43_003361 [Brettanomyces nanus]|uniref:Pre-mRNA-splicing factor ISY1 n=1 Tax=Eeniella nana TaxID=13502 RepID=A0A875S6P0_EENNA|nr:uncharacterized protein FOA43_003361 [Brettanomyces nanus]QPG75975.1 hypothetical protein FOA43_003361 [Brettanomyces nanus]
MLHRKKEANSGLNRYYSENAPQISRERPSRTQDVKNASDAEACRKMCMKDINRDLIRINDALTEEYQIRELNDKLNKLMRELRSWEYRIKELGGPDYFQKGGEQFYGNAAKINGYRYYGRAKELPDVQKLLNANLEQQKRDEQQKSKKRSDKTALKMMTAHEFSPMYYGLDQELENRHLIPSENEIADEMSYILGTKNVKISTLITLDKLKESNEEYYREKAGGSGDLISFERKRSRELQQEVDKKSDKPLVEFDESFDKELLTSDDVERFIVQRRKEQLLAKLNQSL